MRCCDITTTAFLLLFLVSLMMDGTKAAVVAVVERRSNVTSDPVAITSILSETPPPPQDTIERQEAQHRIFGGSDAALGAFPYQGLYRTTDGVICGCSLISQKWAITAAHCTIAHDASKMFLTFGVVDRRSSTNAQVFTVVRKVEHPSYNSETLVNDVSLLELTTEAVYDSFVQPITIPDQGVDVTVGKSCIISGWGTVEDGTNPYVMQQASVPVISNSQCQYWLSTTGLYIRSTFLCAGFSAGGVDTCRGDSGGPLACWDSSNSRYVLDGITSFGFGCANPRSPGIYTRVSEYSDWIARNTASAGTTSLPVLASSLLLSLLSYRAATASLL